jgi:hypothetical protein
MDAEIPPPKSPSPDGTLLESPHDDWSFFSNLKRRFPDVVLYLQTCLGLVGVGVPTKVPKLPGIPEPVASEKIRLPLPGSDTTQPPPPKSPDPILADLLRFVLDPSFRAEMALPPYTLREYLAWFEKELDAAVARADSNADNFSTIQSEAKSHKDTIANLRSVFEDVLEERIDEKFKSLAEYQEQKRQQRSEEFQQSNDDADRRKKKLEFLSALREIAEFLLRSVTH